MRPDARVTKPFGLLLCLGGLISWPAEIRAADSGNEVGVASSAKPESPKLPMPDAGTVDAQAARGKRPRLPVLGIGLDAGLPDGINLSVVARPYRWARVHLGMGNNGISYGWRIGVTALPLGDGPAAIVEYGHYGDGNANGLASKLVGSSFRSSPFFDRVGYDYVNLHLGLNLGYRRVVFFIQGGLSILRGELHGTDQAVRKATSGLSNTEVAVHSNPTIKATGFAGKLGLVTYVW